MADQRDDQVGEVHTHDRRRCWDCNGLGICAGAISLRVVERTLQQLGWRFLEPHGRMICSECSWRRRAGQVPPTIGGSRM